MLRGVRGVALLNDSDVFIILTHEFWLVRIWRYLRVVRSHWIHRLVCLVKFPERILLRGLILSIGCGIDKPALRKVVNFGHESLQLRVKGHDSAIDLLPSHANLVSLFLHTLHLLLKYRNLPVFLLYDSKQLINLVVVIYLHVRLFLRLCCFEVLLKTLHLQNVYVMLWFLLVLSRCRYHFAQPRGRQKHRWLWSWIERELGNLLPPAG